MLCVLGLEPFLQNLRTYYALHGITKTVAIISTRCSAHAIEVTTLVSSCEKCGKNWGCNSSVVSEKSSLKGDGRSLYCAHLPRLSLLCTELLKLFFLSSCANAGLITFLAWSVASIRLKGMPSVDIRVNFLDKVWSQKEGNISEKMVRKPFRV